MSERATFDPFFHRTDLKFESQSQLLNFIENLSGNNEIKSRALHEFSHYFVNHSPVTKALRLFKIKASISLLKNKVTTNDLAFALDQWTSSNVILQYYLPIYEGISLLSEFDLTLNIRGHDSDLILIQEMYLAHRMKVSKSSPFYGFHNPILGAKDKKYSRVLDSHLAYAMSDAYQNRKMALLMKPLVYEKPSDCYLVSYLFAKEVQRKLSEICDENINVSFVIKYLRSFFLEDWGVVEILLDLIEGKHQDTGRVFRRLNRRLEILYNELNAKDIDTYRQSVERLQSHKDLWAEGLDGLRLDDVDSPKLGQRLIELEINSLVNNINEESPMIVQALNNREFFNKVYQGNFTCWSEGDRFFIVSGENSDKKIISTQTEISNRKTSFPKKVRNLTFFICHIHGIPRVVHFSDNGTDYSFCIGDKKFPVPIFPRIFGESNKAEAIISSINNKIMKTSGLHINKEVIAASKDTSRLFSNWLSCRGGVYKVIEDLARIQGLQNIPKVRPVWTILRKYFSYQDFKHIVLTATLHGVGYNIRYLCKDYETAIEHTKPFNFSKMLGLFDLIYRNHGIECHFFDTEKKGNLEIWRFLI